MKMNAKVVWLGAAPVAEYFTKSAKGEVWEMCSLTLHSRQGTTVVKLGKEQGTWLAAMLPLLSADNMKLLTLQEVQVNFEAAGLEDFELFWENKPMNTLYKAGLLVV
jgi:hypothetical protein